jgi:hypothetical protein
VTRASTAPTKAMARIGSSSGSRQTRRASTGVTTSAIASNSVRTAAARSLAQPPGLDEHPLEFTEDRGADYQGVITTEDVIEQTSRAPAKVERQHPVHWCRERPALSVLACGASGCGAISRQLRRCLEAGRQQPLVLLHTQRADPIVCVAPRTGGTLRARVRRGSGPLGAPDDRPRR